MLKGLQSPTLKVTSSEERASHRDRMTSTQGWPKLERNQVIFSISKDLFYTSRTLLVLLLAFTGKGIFPRNHHRV